MGEIAGIKYTKDATGHKRYVRVDLNMYGENQLLEDFSDMLEIEAHKGEPTIPLREFIKEQNKKRGIDV
jgi:hypothetical protein